MKLFVITITLMIVVAHASAFHFITRKWDFGDSRENIDTLAVDNGNLFITRNNKMQWIRPVVGEPITHLSRDFPRAINRLSVRQKALLVSMVPPECGSVSETYLFSNGKSCRMLWKDNTMHECVINENGNLLRSNYFGNITYGNHEGMFSYSTITHTNLTYSAMVVCDKRLWCAAEYNTGNKTHMTRIDVFDIFVKLNGTDHISSVPDMSFLVENKGCSHPHLLSVSIEKNTPNDDIVCIIIGYMGGGVNVAQASYPPEKKTIRAMCANLPNEYPVRSVSWDKPYLFFLDERGISSYRIILRASVHQHLGKYILRKNHFSQTTQIASIKRHVFWNGEDVLRSVEIVE